jgi:hypothetical protein
MTGDIGGINLCFRETSASIFCPEEAIDSSKMVVTTTNIIWHINPEYQQLHLQHCENFKSPCFSMLSMAWDILFY